MSRRSSSAWHSPVSVFCFIVMVVAGVALDQWSKIAAFSKLGGTPHWDSRGVVHVPPVRVYEFIPGWVHFEVIANQGAVFGLGQGKRILFIAVSIGAILFIFHLFTVSGRQHFYQIVLGMLLAGVLGNLYDRVHLGYVRDMIHALPRWEKLFPYIFNVADSLLCVGVALMIFHSFFQSPPSRSRSR